MKKKRAVAYVRVSSGSRAQLHSYEFQSDYWHGRFENDPTTELVGFYADKGISGRSMAKRPQFLIMLQDAREGKFEIPTFYMIQNTHLKHCKYAKNRAFSAKNS